MKHSLKIKIIYGAPSLQNTDPANEFVWPEICTIPWAWQNQSNLECRILSWNLQMIQQGFGPTAW